MRMQKRQFRIGELAQYLEVEKFVVRFWEKEFELKPSRSEGGQRFYEEKDIAKFQLIKKLLYDQGFTISGAKKALKDQHAPLQVLASKRTTIDAEPTCSCSQALHAQIKDLRKQLIKLQDVL